MENVRKYAQHENIKEIAASIVAELGNACVKNVALGDGVADAHGLAFWFPSSVTSFRNDHATYERLAFSQNTKWVEYLRAQFGR